MKTVCDFIDQNGKVFWLTYYDPGGPNPHLRGGGNPFPKKDVKSSHLTGKTCSLPLGNKKKVDSTSSRKGVRK